MTEQDVFHGALEIEDPKARLEFSNVACATNQSLRNRLERLITSHFQTQSFLDATLIDQVTAAKHSLSFLLPPVISGAIGRLDHYDVLNVIGRGGISVVLKRHYSKLQRVVALKLLGPQFAISPKARKQFIHERKVQPPFVTNM
ncbi:MAG: hypothetical protein QM703_13325 [Gemmatales bacterium]